jgi:tungstate transport system permease protein
LEIIREAFEAALDLIVSLDPQVLSIVGMTLRVTGMGLLLAIVIGLPVGIWLGLSRRIPIAGCLVPIIYTGMGIPPVVAGLFVYLMLSNQGPLGELRWLFTPPAMILAQTIISLPLVIGLTLTAVQAVDPQVKLQVRALGATRAQLAWAVISEARLGVLAAIVTAFGSIISEVGAVMLVGGNIEGETRVLTTAIVLETRKGNFGLALALGLLLLGLAFFANYLLYRLQIWGDDR